MRTAQSAMCTRRRRPLELATLSNSDASYAGQAVGVVLTGVFVCVASAIVWLGLKFTIGLRPSEEDEDVGLDRAEIGLEAYPEFVRS